jgi:AraC family transcriptional regulator
MQLAQSDAVTMPAGELHEARFGTRGAQIVIVKAIEASATATRCLNRLAGLRGPVFGWLAWRLAGELQAADAAAPIAAEGFALELLAAAGREAHPAPRSRQPPPWLRSVEELLRASTDERLGLRELSAAVGVDPAHVARAFRARHGVSVGEYARQLRLAWAAGELSRTETPLALIAAQAGFADQSHFTRLFRQHLGITPARYRRETRRDSDRTA